MTNELMSRFNMKGKRGKMGFQYTQLYRVIKGKKNAVQVFTPQPLRAVGVLFLPKVSGWAGGKKFVWAVSQTVRCRKFITW